MKALVSALVLIATPCWAQTSCPQSAFIAAQNDAKTYVLCVTVRADQLNISGSLPEDIATAAMSECSFAKGQLERDVLQCSISTQETVEKDADKRARGGAVQRVVELRAAKR